jgi:hypothetical protein
MSERLPYEDELQQHWNDLPLPDENKAWEDMKRRLEEEDDDRPIIAWWRRGCLLWGFLLLVIFSSGLWLIRERYFSSDNNKKEAVTKQEEVTGNKKKDSVIMQRVPSNAGPDGSRQNTKDKNGPLKEITEGPSTENTGKPLTDNESGIDDPASIVNKKKQEIEIKERTGIENPVVTGRRGKRNNSVVMRKGNTGSTTVSTGSRTDVKELPRKQVSVQKKPAKEKLGQVDTMFLQPDQVYVSDVPLRTGGHPFTGKPDSIASQAPVKRDSIFSKPPSKKDSLAINTPNKDSTKKKKQITFSAGIAMQQLLPVAGQKTVPYNSLGRKGTLADYIPSIYFRAIKEKKWFVQGEFRYGAPQYTKEFVYNQQQREDTAGPIDFTTRTTSTLKKTYYHQLPVTFNYFVAKDWSVGAGLSWNKFVSAIADIEVRRRNNTTTLDSVLRKGLFAQKGDSATAFSKSYFQGVIESQYKWKRFSFGARYTFGLQPYVKFTLLNGETGQDRSSSLQVFLRYELWQSKKKE